MKNLLGSAEANSRVVNSGNEEKLPHQYLTDQSDLSRYVYTLSSYFSI